MFILACYLVLAYRGLRIAALARDPFDKLLAAGLTSAVVIQALVIIGGNIRLMPIAGVHAALHELRPQLAAQQLHHHRHAAAHLGQRGARRAQRHDAQIDRQNR